MEPTKARNRGIGKRRSLLTGVVAAVVGMGIVGWLLFRSRRRQTLVKRLQDAIPGPVRDLPTGLQARIRRAK